MSDAHPLPTRWGMVCLAIGAAMLGAFQIGKVPVALGDIRIDLGLGLVAASWVISIFSVLAFAGGMVAGVTIRRLGDRRVAAAGLLMLAVGSAAGAAAPDEWFLLAARFVEGIGFLLLHVSTQALIQRYVRPEDQPMAFGMWGAYMGTGQAIIMVAAPALLDVVGWRGLWLVNAMVAAAYAILLLFAARAPSVSPLPDTGSRSFRWADMRDTLKAPGPWALGLCFGAYALNYMAVVGFLPTILVEDMQLSPRTAAFATALAVLMNGVANLLGGTLLHRGVPRWLLLVAAHIIMGACALGIFASALPIGWRYPLVLLFMFGGLLPGVVVSGVILHAPRRALMPTTNGLITQCTALGQVLGPPAVAFAATLAGTWSAAGLVPAVSGIFGIALAVIIRRLESKRTA